MTDQVLGHPKLHVPWGSRWREQQANESQGGGDIWYRLLMLLVTSLAPGQPDARDLLGHYINGFLGHRVVGQTQMGNEWLVREPNRGPDHPAPDLHHSSLHNTSLLVRQQPLV